MVVALSYNYHIGFLHNAAKRLLGIFIISLCLDSICNFH